MAGSLYHYTDVNAVRSILEKRQLWLSDIRFLNDSQEMNDGSRFVLDALDDLLPVPGMDKDCFDNAKERLREAFDDHISFDIDDEPTFVCSFSEAGNQLSQWRAYGKYAVELDLAFLGDLDLFCCYYDESEKKREAEVMVRDVVYGLTQELSANGGQPLEDTGSYLSLLVRTASVFKDQSFHEEKEVRWVVDLALPNKDLQFRSKGDLLIPYIALDFPFEAIKAIHVGPMRDQDLAYTSMCSFVSKLRHESILAESKYVPEINVIQSNVPYRSPL